MISHGHGFTVKRLQAYRLTSSSTRPAGPEVAISALKDEPVWSRVAEVAHPLDELGIGLYDLESVATVSWDSHSEWYSYRVLDMYIGDEVFWYKAPHTLKLLAAVRERIGDRVQR